MVILVKLTVYIKWLNYFLREVKLAMGIKNIMLFYPATDVCSVVYSVLSLVTCTVDFFQRTREIKECTAPTHTIRGRVQPVYSPR